MTFTEARQIQLERWENANALLRNMLVDPQFQNPDNSVCRKVRETAESAVKQIFELKLLEWRMNRDKEDLS